MSFPTLHVCMYMYGLVCCRRETGPYRTATFPPHARTIPDEVDGTYMYHVDLGLLVVNALGRPGPRVGSGNHASAGDHAIIIGA